jgi:hypothetical protein
MRIRTQLLGLITVLVVLMPDVAVYALHAVNPRHAAMLQSVPDLSRDVEGLSGRAATFDDPSSRVERLLGENQGMEARHAPTALRIVGMLIEGRQCTASARMNAECQPLLRSLQDATTGFSDHGTALATEIEAARADEHGKGFAVVTTSNFVRF